MHARWLACAVFLSFFLVGCGSPASKSKEDADAEIKSAFKTLQTAIKDRSGEKIWDVLDTDSRQDADRVARGIKESFEKGDDAKKADLAKKVGLADAKLKSLTGKTFLESDLFYRFDEHDELDEVKGLDKIEVKGTTAKLAFKDPDNPEKMMSMKAAREDGKWRFNLGMPKVPE